MPIDLTSDKAFDDYAAGFGWSYDNGGRYRDELWDWYAGRDAGIVLMRQSAERVALVRFESGTPREIWAGSVSNSGEFDQVMEVLAREQADQARN